jgi:hypothetical protein
MMRQCGRCDSGTMMHDGILLALVRGRPQRWFTRTPPDGCKRTWLVVPSVLRYRRGAITAGASILPGGLSVEMRQRGDRREAYGTSRRQGGPSPIFTTRVTNVTLASLTRPVTSQQPGVGKIT